MIIEIGDGTYTAGDLEDWNGHEVWLHPESPISLLNPQGSALLALPDGDCLPAGWHCLLHISSPANIDSGSGAFQLKPQGNATLNHYWNSSHPYGRFVNLTMGMARLSYNGNNEYALGGMSFHHNAPQSQRTLADDDYAYCPITPASENEIYRVDVGACGGNVLLGIDPIAWWCPLSPMTNGHYPSYHVTVQKCDNASGGLLGIRQMRVASGGGFEDDPAHPIHPSNDFTVTGNNRGYYYLRNRWDTVELYIAADGVKVIKTFRESFATS